MESGAYAGQDGGGIPPLILLLLTACLFLYYPQHTIGYPYMYFISTCMLVLLLPLYMLMLMNFAKSTSI